MPRPRHSRSIRGPAAHRLGGLLAAGAWLAAAAPVAAHEQQVIKYGSFLGGLFHPALGPDHLLAMLSVGILSVQIGGRAILTVPATFVCVMAVGGAVGLLTAAIPMGVVELGISLSVLFLGAIIALGRRLPVPGAMVAVGFFATFHGYAHGVETPRIAEPLQYVAGFLLGTALIHILGVLVGEVAIRYAAGPRALRVGGALIGLVGALFLVGLL
jgi:urease accessory protein